MKLGTNIFVFTLALVLLNASAEQCGKQAGGAVCPNGLCCSQFGWCGSTDDYCSPAKNCQSQCKSGGATPTPTPSGGGSGDVGSVISASLFEQMLKHRNDAACKGHGFYSYDAFINAAGSFGGFGTTGDVETRKREIAAFFGQTSHETTGGWDTAPDGKYAWGYCFVREGSNTASSGYYGRGPIQLTQ